MRRWAWFGGALLLALGTSLGWGLTAMQSTEPWPAARLGPGETVQFRGLEFSDPVIGEDQVPPEMTAQVPAGASVARMDLTLTVIAPEAEEGHHLCYIELQTPAGRYQTTGALRAPDCTNGPDWEPLKVGDSQRITTYWVVPEPIDDRARVKIHFQVRPALIEVRGA